MGAALQRAAIASPPRYERRRPEQTLLYRLVREHYETFVADVDANGTGLPQFVKDEFDAYLECGILAHGFLRLTCDTCARDTLVAFSCKRRGICPSCGTRRMAETAAYLVDHILPRVPVRQWVLSFPIPLRSLFAVHPELLTPVLRIIHRVIHTHLIKQSGVKRTEAASGAITLIQRFGSAANLNTHLHALVLDGVYQTSAESAPVFIEAPAPSNEQLQTLLDKIIRRILKLLTRLGHLIEEDGVPYMARSESLDPDDVMAPLQAASSTALYKPYIFRSPTTSRRPIQRPHVPTSPDWVRRCPWVYGMHDAQCYTRVGQSEVNVWCWLIDGRYIFLCSPFGIYHCVSSRYTLT